MYTQCPKCRAIFKLDEDVLQASLGIVCCGNCGQRFDALRTLSDRVPTGPDPLLPEHDPERLSPALTQRVAMDAAGSAAAGSALDAAPAGGPAPTDNAAPAVVRPTARSAARAQALIAAAAGIPRDAIIENSTWQVTRLPVLTAIILNESISSADLGSATVVANPDPPGESASIAPPGATEPPAEPQAGAPPRAAPGTGAPAVPVGHEPAATVTPSVACDDRPPDDTIAPSSVALEPSATDGAMPEPAADAAFATTPFLRIEDASASARPASPAVPPGGGSPDATPAGAPAPDTGRPAATPDHDASPASLSPPPADPSGHEAASISPLDRWLGGGLSAPDDDSTPALDGPAMDTPSADDPVAPYAGSSPEVLPESPDVDGSQAGPEPVYVPPRHRRIAGREGWWLLGCAALALALALQLAWAQRAEFVRNPATRAWTLRVCGKIDCRLPPIRDVDMLTLLSRDVRPDPARPGALAITATIRNEAPFRQPWPVVVVRMTDIDNRVVAMRRFRPVEYLASAAQRAHGIPPETTAAIALEVRDPGHQATGFRFDFE